MQRQYGRNKSPVDERDYKLSSFIPKDYDESLIKEKKWRFYGKPLDQQDRPHCCGYSMANFGINDPINSKYRNEDGDKFYYLCKIKDGEPGAETGSDIRTVAKVLVDLGIIKTYAFASTMAELKYWLLNKGCVIVGTDWYEGMESPDENNIVHISGKIVGGHAYLLNEVKIINGKVYFGIQNSWNGYWGVNGKAYISAKDFESLLTRWGGEAIAAVEVPHELVVPKADPNARFNLINFLIALWGRILGKN